MLVKDDKTRRLQRSEPIPLKSLKKGGNHASRMKERGIGKRGGGVQTFHLQPNASVAVREDVKETIAWSRAIAGCNRMEARAEDETKRTEGKRGVWHANTKRGKEKSSSETEKRDEFPKSTTAVEHTVGR